MESESILGDPQNVSAMAHAAGTARTLVGYSVEGAATALGISTSLLSDIESGTVDLNAELQALIEDRYGIGLESLLREAPNYRPRTPISYDAAKGILRVGTLGVRFRIGLDDNDVLLRGFSSAVRRQRQFPPSVPLQLRRADLPVLATLLDLEDPDLDSRAQFWFGQTPQTAQSFRAMLKLSRETLDEAA